MGATWYHKAVGQWLLIALVLLHVAAIGWYARRRKQNLVPPMISGDKELAGPAVSSRDDFASRVVALAVLVVCAGLVAWIVSLGAAPPAP